MSTELEADPVVTVSMHWTLVKFRKGELITSDHPVAIWHLGRGSSRPEPNDFSWGIGNSLEIAMPLAPDLLLLLTWLDDCADEVVSTDRGALVATVNSFVSANAEKQWFARPGQKAWRSKGVRRPVSEVLYPGYCAEIASGSSRRKRATRLAEIAMGKPLSNEPLEALMPN